MRKILFYIIVCFTTILGCIEPFEFEVRTAENVLVVEAILTDQIMKQQIFLKRASNLEKINLPPEDYNPNEPIRPIEDETNYEENAIVTIIDDLGIRYEFTEIEPGTYESDITFATELERTYQLLITTSSNEVFESDTKNVPGESKINKVYAERNFNEEGVEGMSIYVDGEDINLTSNYFRYEFEETYKIIAPNWTSVELDLVFEGDGTVASPPIIAVVPRDQEEQICYGKVKSSSILLANTSNLNTPQIERNLVRFIDRANPILSHRYSILVKQYLQSFESYSYYENLRNFARSESVFSEIQPGFLEGNIRSAIANKPVIGYFDIVSVSQERIFFDYIDFFEGEDLPPYFFDFNCNRILSFPLLKTIGCPPPLPVQIRLELVEYLDVNNGADIMSACPGPYLVTPRICGDCTVLGSNLKPDFWIE